MSPCSRARSIHSEISRRRAPVRSSSSSTRRWWACGDRCVSSIAPEATQQLSGLLQRAGVVAHPGGVHAAVGLRLALDDDAVAGLDVALGAGLRPGVAGRLVGHHPPPLAVGPAVVNGVPLDYLDR